MYVFTRIPVSVSYQLQDPPGRCLCLKLNSKIREKRTSIWGFCDKDKATIPGASAVWVFLDAALCSSYFKFIIYNSKLNLNSRVRV
jgi:hypothetical protein